MATTFLTANGTLMRSLEFNPNMQEADGIFVREGRIDAHYRLWSIGDRHPGMARVNEEETHASVEIWQLSLASFAALLMDEPAGLAIDKIKFAGGSEVLDTLVEN